MGNSSSTWEKADRVIDSLVSGLDLEGIVFSKLDDHSQDVENDSPKGQIRVCVHRAIQCFREGRQYFEGNLFDEARNKFNESIGAMMQFSMPSKRHFPTLPILSVYEIVDFTIKRSFCLQHLNPGLGFQKRLYSFGTLQALEDCECFENKEEYQLLVDALLVMSLTCLAECYELLGQSAHAEKINTARGQLQKALYGNDSLKYSFSCKNLRGFCSCADKSKCTCMMKSNGSGNELCSLVGCSQDTSDMSDGVAMAAEVGHPMSQDDDQQLGVIFSEDDEILDFVDFGLDSDD